MFEKVLFTLNSLQYRYLKYIALVNRINIGILKENTRLSISIGNILVVAPRMTNIVQ